MLSVGMAAAFTGCTYSLHPYNTPSNQTIRIVGQAPQEYVVRVEANGGGEFKDYTVATNGLVTILVPSLPRGSAVRGFGLVKVADSQSEDVKAICLVKNGKAVREFSLNDLSKLSTDSEGVRQMKVK